MLRTRWTAWRRMQSAASSRPRLYVFRLDGTTDADGGDRLARVWPSPLAGGGGGGGEGRVQLGSSGFRLMTGCVCERRRRRLGGYSPWKRGLKRRMCLHRIWRASRGRRLKRQQTADRRERSGDIISAFCLIRGGRIVQTRLKIFSSQGIKKERRSRLKNKIINRTRKTG